MRRYFRGPGDWIALGVVIFTLAALLYGVGLVHGRTQARLDYERSCGDRWSCLAQASGYELIRTRR